MPDNRRTVRTTVVMAIALSALLLGSPGGPTFAGAGDAARTNDAADRAERAAERAERAAERSEAAAKRVEDALTRIERLLERFAASDTGR